MQIEKWDFLGGTSAVIQRFNLFAMKLLIWTKTRRPHVRARHVAQIVSAFSIILFATALSSPGDSYKPRILQSISISFGSDVNPSWREERDDFASKIRSTFGLGDEANDFAHWIIEAAESQNLDPDLLASVISVESSFRIKVRSAAGAVGPAQVKQSAWRDFCASDHLASAPDENIACGAQIIALYLDKCGSLSCALKSYNIGYYNRADSYYNAVGQRYLNKVRKRLVRLHSPLEAQLATH